MVVKYGNIILLMETLINGTCYKVSTDVLYGLRFLHPTNLPVYICGPSQCPSEAEEDTCKGKFVQGLSGPVTLPRNRVAGVCLQGGRPETMVG